MLLLGCIADDFTGASDAASFLVKGGLRTILWNGIPSEPHLPDERIQAVVIALKTRTQNTKDAVEESMRALKWLKAAGSQQLYIKYCSTFDSTPKGNIGPVLDKALDWLGVPYTVLCPSLPVNGRTVLHGELFVEGIPVHQSHMKDHPLTPIWDSSITALMKPQSKYSCSVISREMMHNWIENGMSYEMTDPSCRYVIPDYESQSDAECIAELFGELNLLTGGSGLLEVLARKCARQISFQNAPINQIGGKTLLLAGSCSQATLAQIDYYQRHGGISYKIDPLKLFQNEESLDAIWNFVEEYSDTPVLIYSSDTSSHVKAVQQNGIEVIASLLESTMAEVAKRALNCGYNKIIVAGGETSGAVTRRLGYQAYEVGGCVAPGVPIMVPLQQPDIRLVLKSGNFGQETFLLDSICMLSGEADAYE